MTHTNQNRLVLGSSPRRPIESKHDNSELKAGLIPAALDIAGEVRSLFQGLEPGRDETRIVLALLLLEE